MTEETKLAWTPQEIADKDHLDPEKRRLKEMHMWPTEPTGDWSNYVEHVPTEDILPYAEYDRGGEHNHRDQQWWQDFRDHVQQHGINTPIMLDYNPDTYEAHISEGNHRIQMAHELGIPHVPVVLYRSMRRGNQTQPVPNPLDPVGVPQYIRPSDVGFAVKTAKKRARYSFFKIAPDIEELAQRARQKLLQREDIAIMNVKYVLPDGRPAIEEPGQVITDGAWEENYGAVPNPKYNPMNYQKLKRLLMSMPPQTFKLYPWIVKQWKKNPDTPPWGSVDHLKDIMTQAWQHMEYLRSQPPNSPNKEPVPDINQMQNYSDLEQWVYARNSTGIDVRPGTQWEYTEGEPSGETHPNSELEENPVTYPHATQTVKWDVGDGWYVWPVYTDQDLKQEGELMGHCVGGYCTQVQKGDTVIYSLRDPKGEPHATIELEPQDGTHLKFVQVQGKSNSEPSPEYKEKVRKFFEQLEQEGYELDQRIEIDDVYELNDYDEQYGGSGADYGIDTDVNIDLDAICRELVEQAKDNYDLRSETSGLERLIDEGHLNRHDVAQEIKYYTTVALEEKEQELEYEWKQERQRLWEEWNDEKDQAEADHYDENQYNEPDEQEEFEHPEFEEWLEANYPDEYQKEVYGLQEVAENEMPEVYDLQYRLGSVSKWGYSPQFEVPDTGIYRMPSEHHDTDVAPLERTFDALGPCEKCNNQLTRDQEGIYCPSCGHRSHPDVQNSRIDMYAPLGEGIGEGPFDLMSKWKLADTTPYVGEVWRDVDGHEIRIVNLKPDLVNADIEVVETNERYTVPIADIKSQFTPVSDSWGNQWQAVPEDQGEWNEGLQNSMDTKPFDLQDAGDDQQLRMPEWTPEQKEFIEQRAYEQSLEWANKWPLAIAQLKEGLRVGEERGWNERETQLLAMQRARWALERQYEMPHDQAVGWAKAFMKRDWSTVPVKPPEPDLGAADAMWPNTFPEGWSAQSSTSYWSLEGAQLRWWLPNKTAADVQQLADKAYEQLWNRDDLKKLWGQSIEYTELCEQISSRGQTGNHAVRRLNRMIAMVLAMHRSGQDEGPLFRKNVHSQGYTDEEVDKAIELAPQLAALQPAYDQSEILYLVLSDLKKRYPESYKIWPWAVKQAKQWFKGLETDPQRGYNDGRGYFDLTTLWAHFSDIVGQVGGLLTQLRQQNQLPQGFDINQMSYEDAEQWLKDYQAQHVGEGWEERNVWATLPNGWTVEEVRTPADLQREGELMGHCVGGYCRNVEAGKSLIFSLRDPNGGSHVTFEFKPVYEQTNDDGTPVDPNENQYIDSNKITQLQLVQVQGKSDSKPKPEYQEMVAEFNKYLQGEGYKVSWADNAWRHDRGPTEWERQQLRNDNIYDLRGIEGLHQLEHDYDRNGGTSFFTKQVPPLPDEYGIMAPSGVPEQWLQHPQLKSATDDVLYEIFTGAIPQAQWEDYARKLIVAWYSLLSQPYASNSDLGHANPYSPKSPVDARQWLIQHIATWTSRIIADYNKQDENPEWPARRAPSQTIIDNLSRLTAFQNLIGGKIGNELLRMTTPDVGPGGHWDEMWKSAPRWRIDQEQGTPQDDPALIQNYLPYPYRNYIDHDYDDEPGYHPEAKVAEVYMPYRFMVGKDGRIFGGLAYEHRALGEQYNLDHDPAWNEVARGEYDPDGTQTLAEFPNSPFGPDELASRVHQWVGTINDPHAPQPNGQVNYNRWTKGQGWDRQQFRVNSSSKWSMPMTIPQQQRAWESLGANPKVVYEFQNGWTVRQAQSPEDVDAIGTLCRNCWQGYDNHFDTDPKSVYFREPEYYALFNTHGLPITAFYVRENEGGYKGITQALGPRNRNLTPEEDDMLQEFADSMGYYNELHHTYREDEPYLDVLRQRDMVDTEPLRKTIEHRACPNCGYYPLEAFGNPVIYEECPKCAWSTETDRDNPANEIPPLLRENSWKYSVAGIPANYTQSDPLDLQGKQPVFQNMQVDWWKLPVAQQVQAIVNAFRATMLSPRLNLKNNAIMYQEFMSIPADESDPDVFEQHARDLKARWDRQGQGDLMGEVEPIGWEKVVPGKLIPGFWGNIRRLAALGPYAEDLRQAALDDLNNNGGRGDLFRNEVLKLGIPGVGPKVASFAWLALNPVGSDLATLDVWMMRHLKQDVDSPNSPSHYFDLENQLRDEKDTTYGPNTPLGQYQWGVWDKIRTPGYHQDHSPLKVHEPTPYTDVAWSPQYRAPRPQQLPEQHPDQEALFANRNG